MFFDDTRTALMTLLGQPIAIAAVVVLAGMNAAIWLLVFRRVGYPTALAPMMLVPPLTFVLPLYVALSRWPGPQRFIRFPSRPLAVPRAIHHPAPRRPVEPPPSFDLHAPVRLAVDGLPRHRIALPSHETPVPVAPPAMGRSALDHWDERAPYWS